MIADRHGVEGVDYFAVRRWVDAVHFYTFLNFLPMYFETVRPFSLRYPYQFVHDPHRTLSSWYVQLPFFTTSITSRRDFRSSSLSSASVFNRSCSHASSFRRSSIWSCAAICFTPFKVTSLPSFAICDILSYVTNIEQSHNASYIR